MTVIRTEIGIAAMPDVCFDLARSVDAHLESARASNEQAIAGVTSGLLALHDEVTWQARHLGIVHELTSRITAYDRPHHFRDEMVRGPFRRLTHDHHFRAESGVTRMTDVLSFAAPFGLAGVLAERMFLAAYMRRFLEERARVLKAIVESGAAQRYV